MTIKKSIIYLLGEFGGSKTKQELAILWCECYPDRVDEKRRYYLSKGKEKTEKELFSQITSEIRSYVHNNPNLFIIEDSKYSLTEEGMEMYKQIVSDIPPDFEVDSKVIETVDETMGIVYLLKSKTYPGTYKIGITVRDIDDRLKELRKDHRYGVFNLELVMWVRTNNYQLVEQVLDKFFEDFRLGRDNDLSVDTELFKGNDTIEEEFGLFVEMLQRNPRYKVGELKN
jgi:hypothetical protein